LDSKTKVNETRTSAHVRAIVQFLVFVQKLIQEPYNCWKSIYAKMY